MSDFDERSGVVTCTTEWGRWWQTGDEVVIQVDLPVRTTAKQIKCIISHDSIAISVADNCILKVLIVAYCSVLPSLITGRPLLLWIAFCRGNYLLLFAKMNVCGHWKTMGDCWWSFWRRVYAEGILFGLLFWRHLLTTRSTNHRTITAQIHSLWTRCRRN